MVGGVPIPAGQHPEGQITSLRIRAAQWRGCLSQGGSDVHYRLPPSALLRNSGSQPMLELEWEGRKLAGAIEAFHSR